MSLDLTVKRAHTLGTSHIYEAESVNARCAMRFVSAAIEFYDAGNYPRAAAACRLAAEYFDKAKVS